MRDRILITGFGPYPEVERNPTEAIMMELREKGYNTLVLPVDLGAVDEIISREIDPERWDFVINTGLNPKIEWVNLERVGINMDDFRIPDNSGRIVRERRIIPEGCDGYITSLALRDLEDHLKGLLGFNVRISNSAGTYLCNHVYYLCLHRMNRRALFIHVPKEKHLSIEEGVSLIEAVVDYLVMINGQARDSQG